MITCPECGFDLRAGRCYYRGCPTNKPVKLELVPLVESSPAGSLYADGVDKFYPVKAIQES